MENQLINIIGILLGILAPAMFLFSLSRGIQSVQWGNEQKKSFWNKILMGVVAWTVLIFASTSLGWFEYMEGDSAPRFLIGLFIPVTLGLILFMRPAFVEILNRIPMHVLVGSQFFRLFGAVFFLVASSGLGPMEFVSSGYGDIVTGLLSVIAAWMLYKNIKYARIATWLFSIMGLLDLANVSRILLVHYPTWSDAHPSTALAGSFPLMLVIGITAPIALLLHIYTLRVLVNSRHYLTELA